MTELFVETGHPPVMPASMMLDLRKRSVCTAGILVFVCTPCISQYSTGPSSHCRAHHAFALSCSSLFALSCPFCSRTVTESTPGFLAITVQARLRLRVYHPCPLLPPSVLSLYISCPSSSRAAAASVALSPPDRQRN